MPNVAPYCKVYLLVLLEVAFINLCTPEEPYQIMFKSQGALAKIN